MPRGAGPRLRLLARRITLCRVELELVVGARVAAEDLDGQRVGTLRWRLNRRWRRGLHDRSWRRPGGCGLTTRRPRLSHRDGTRAPDVVEHVVRDSATSGDGVRVAVAAKHEL